MASSNIAELANSVASNTAKYSNYLAEHGLPLPSHDPTVNPAPTELPHEIAAARDAAIHASYELHELLIGPDGILLNGFYQSSRILSLDFIHTHKIGQSLGPTETATFGEVATQHGLDENDTKRMLRLAMTNHIFTEPEPGVVAHTAASYALVRDPHLAAWLGVAAKEIWPGFLRVTEAMSKWPGSTDPLQTAFALAHNFKDLPFVEWEKDPPRAKQFSDAMKFLYRGADAGSVLDDYDFSNKESVTFVDVGGSHGEAAIQLAEKHPQLSCIVQDLPTVITAAESSLPKHMKGRVKYMVHDFWTEQPVKGADIYYLRWVLHDWSDPYAAKLLKQIVPALKPGARVIINDACIPPAGVLTMKQEMDLRSIDLLMKAFTNAGEREGGDWANLFSKADPGFKFLGVTPPPPGGRFSTIQAEWDPVQ